jgi:GntR family transcriptional regulator
MPVATDRSPNAERQRDAVFLPLYKQIKSLLVQRLQQGEWKPGEPIPSELELAARFQVSQGTVRKAVDELAAENLLVRRQGKGTFVATHQDQEPRAQYRFLRLVPDDGEAVPTQSSFLACRRTRAPADVAQQLALRSGEAVIYVRRLLAVGGAPLVLDDIWLPAALFRGLTPERLAEYRGPLYGLFEAEFGTRMIRADERIRAVAAAGDVAALLAVAPGSPLLLVDRVSYTYREQPVEVRRGCCVTTHYHYHNELF